MKWIMMDLWEREVRYVCFFLTWCHQVSMEILETSCWLLNSCSFQPCWLRIAGEPTGALKMFELACRAPWNLRL